MRFCCCHLNELWKLSNHQGDQFEIHKSRIWHHVYLWHFHLHPALQCNLYSIVHVHFSDRASKWGITSDLLVGILTWKLLWGMTWNPISCVYGSFEYKSKDGMLTSASWASSIVLWQSSHQKSTIQFIFLMRIYGHKHNNAQPTTATIFSIKHLHNPVKMQTRSPHKLTIISFLKMSGRFSVSTGLERGWGTDRVWH